jgi:tetratricopeptide (TPR) repeat protein
MTITRRATITSLTCLTFALSLINLSPTAAASAQGYHQVEGRIFYQNTHVGNLRVRLVKQAEMRPIAESISRPEGQFKFNEVPEGDYLVETFETDKFEASSTSVSVRPLVRGSRVAAFVTVELTLKSRSGKEAAPGLIAADVDLEVPKSAQKHYRAGLKALEGRDPARALKEFREAVKIHPVYYAARLELGRELAVQKRYQDAADALKPIEEIAPKRPEWRIEYGKVLYALKRPAEAASELLAALRLQEANWETNFYLGWALLESDAVSAEQYFLRAVALNEKKAARAHLALARLAQATGRKDEAVKHLEAYLALIPDAPDAEAARRLLESLRR